MPSQDSEMSSPSQGRPSKLAPGRKRRKDGCLTCRKRRVGCDRERPSCFHCTRLSLKCSWPVPADIDDPNRTPLRRARLRSQSSSNTLGPDAVSSQVPVGYLTDDKVQTSIGRAQGDVGHHSVEAIERRAPKQVVRGIPSIGSTSLTSTISAASHPALSWLTPITPCNELVPNQSRTTDFDVFDFFNPLGTDGNVESQSSNLAGSFILPPQQNVLWAQPAEAISPQSQTCPPNNPPIIQTAPPRLAILQPVALNLGDQQFISHYLEHVASWAKLRDQSLPNHYLSLFSSALFYSPLYDGILAWSASHLAASLSTLTSPSILEHRDQCLGYAREKHSACGTSLFQALAETIGLPQPPSLDLILPTIMVYCQYEIAAGSQPSHVQTLLEFAKLLVVDLHSRLSTVSPLMQRIAVILATYDVRASMFGLGGADYAMQIAAPLFSPADNGPEKTWHGTTAQNLRINYLFAQSIRIDRDLREGRNTGATDMVRNALRHGDKLYTEIMALRDELDPTSLDPLCEPHLEKFANIDDDLRFLISHAFLASLYNALIIYLCRVLSIPPPPRCSSRIIHSSRNISTLFPDAESMFHRPLFFAALETQDDLLVEWVLSRLLKEAAGGWGTNLVKTHDFLVHIRRLETNGPRQDLGRAMLEFGERFIM